MSGEVLGYVRDYEGKILETCVAYDEGVILYQTGSLQVLKDGPMITYGKISYGEDGRKERITSYWTRRSDSFLAQRRAELHSPLAKRWMAEIHKYLPEDGKMPQAGENLHKGTPMAAGGSHAGAWGRSLRILDVGCGAGFFSILLAKEGHYVTGIDLTPNMISHAGILAREEKVSCDFQVMDAEHLDFKDQTFDMVISRNLTWTLPEASQAYKEWCRVLKPGGLLLNFDANYGADDCTDTSALPKNHAHHQLGDELMRECEEIKSQLPISSYVRPAWDLEVLCKAKMEEFTIDMGVSGRIYLEKDEFYNPTPLFAICAKKKAQL